MSRSSVTRRSSALRRRTSAESVPGGAEPEPGPPAFFAFCTQSYSVCLGIPMRAATSTTVKPRSSTCFTASALNSSVYRLLLMNTSAVAMNYGLRVSTKGWAVHFSLDSPIYLIGSRMAIGLPKLAPIPNYC